ncbi:hypothetical protein B0T13DRAFT_464822 [Neurospora crassa]|nr:hypothetical protein B0T13DRAFT_464822 [Neurospora crassa]
MIGSGALIPSLLYPINSYIGETIIVTVSNIDLSLKATRHSVRLDCSRRILP